VVWIDQGRSSRFRPVTPSSATRARFATSRKPASEAAHETLEENLSLEGAAPILCTASLSAAKRAHRRDLPIVPSRSASRSRDRRIFHGSRRRGWTLLTDTSESLDSPMSVQGRRCALSVAGDRFIIARIPDRARGDPERARRQLKVRSSTWIRTDAGLARVVRAGPPDEAQGALGNHGRRNWSRGCGAARTTEWCRRARRSIATARSASPSPMSASRRGGQSATDTAGQPLRISLGYRINDPEFNQCRSSGELLRGGITRSHRFTLEKVRFDGARDAEGVVEILADPCCLRRGLHGHVVG